MTVDLLRESFYALKRQAAPGVDGMTWAQYEVNLEDRLRDLHGRVHRGAYRALPSKRTYIPKADGRQRPLGIASVEDKVVQQAVVTVLNHVYEEDFLGFSYGFRPGHSPHDALDALWMGIMGKKVNWVLDADIRGFFDAISHEWMMVTLQPYAAHTRDRGCLSGIERVIASKPPCDPFVRAGFFVRPEGARYISPGQRPGDSWELRTTSPERAR